MFYSIVCSIQALALAYPPTIFIILYVCCYIMFHFIFYPGTGVPPDDRHDVEGCARRLLSGRNDDNNNNSNSNNSGKHDNDDNYY